MPVAVFFSLIFIFAAAHLLMGKRSKWRLHGYPQEKEDPTWSDFEASLLDPEEMPDGRIIKALSSIAKKLRLRAALVTVGTGTERQVLASYAQDPSLIAGFGKGMVLNGRSLYCGSLANRPQILAIDYASLSEWRSHSACRDLGWETYFGVCVERVGDQSVVVAFFDTIPREKPFSKMDSLLLEQLGPLIAAMVEVDAFDSARTDGFVYSEETAQVTGEA